MRSASLLSFSLAAVVLSAGCAKAGIPIGSDPLDNAPIAMSPLFAHYQGTMSGATTVGDLLRNPLTFSGRPTPTALLQGIQASNPSAAMDAVPMSFTTLNVGLLDVQIFGLVPYAQTPDLETRAQIMAQTVFAAGYDVIAMQELWRPADVERFRAAARTAGYWIVTSPRVGYTDGLAIAVKTTVAAAPGAVKSEPYSEISANEFFPANGYSRGFLSVRFEHATVGPVVVYATHAAAFPAAYRLRMAHVRELGLHLRRNVPDNELAVVMGDFNAAPYYKADVWNLPANRTEPDWFANTLSYPVLMHYAGVTDLVIRGRSMADSTLDITLGDTVPNNPATAVSVPFGDASWCTSTPNTHFTATDCNSLYFQQYAGTEFPARMDLVMARDPGGRVHVERSELAFATPVAYGGRMGPLSDHYGQTVATRITPRR